MTLATSQELQNNKTYLFFGDSSAERSIYFPNSNKHSISGLPINDHAIELLFRTSSKWDIVFFHCTHPLVGCKEIKAIKAIQNMIIDMRFIPYRHKPENRGFYNDNWWKSLSSDDINLLFENWAQMLNYYYQQNPAIVLLPIRAHWYDRQLNLPNKAMQILAQFKRVV
ncbi:MAG: hypothetical protein WBA93_20125, partial [Microcoleaceae cyanobacterium]